VGEGQANEFDGSIADPHPKQTAANNRFHAALEVFGCHDGILQPINIVDPAVIKRVVDGGADVQGENSNKRYNDSHQEHLFQAASTQEEHHHTENHNRDCCTDIRFQED